MLTKHLPEESPLYSRLLFTLFVVAFYILWSGIFYDNGNGLITYSINIWGDWVVHLTQINAMIEWPIGYWLDHTPFLSEENFRYPPLANVFTALFVASGVNIVKAMTLTSFLLCIALVFMLQRFFSLYTNSRHWAFIGVGLFIFNGGLGFLFAYVQDLDSATHLKELGFVIQNFTISEFVPQRAILFSSPFFIGALWMIQSQLKSNTDETSWKKAIIFAALAIMVIFSSMHTYVALVIICVCVGLQSLRFWRQWLMIAVVCAVTNLPLYFAFYGANDTSGFISYNPGGLIKYSELPMLKYFLYNYGFVLPVFLYAFFKFKYWREPLIVSGIVLFIVVHLIQFQPWIWDNSKLLTWAYLLLLVPCVHFIQSLWINAKCKCQRFWLVLFFLSATLSGAHDVWQLVKPDRNGNIMFSSQDQVIAEKFKTIARYDDLTLTHISGHNDWVYALSGRPVYKGFSGWLWSWGFDSGKYDKRSDQMLNGDVTLLKEKNIKFIVIDKYKDPHKVNNDYMSTLKLIHTDGRFRIYDTGL